MFHTYIYHCIYNMYTSHNTKLGLVRLRVLKSVYGSQLAQPRCHFNMGIAMCFCLLYLIMIFKMAAEECKFVF